MRYLVTGCAGFIGSTLTDELLRDGHHVVGIDCFSDYYDPGIKRSNLTQALEHESFDLLEVDLARGSLSEHLEGIDGAFHLAAQAGVRASWGSEFASYASRNVLATQRLLESLTQLARSPRVVYASSSSIYGEALAYPTSEDAVPAPVSPYGVTKLAGEHLCSSYHHNYGLATVCLRYFTVFGERQRPDMAFHRFIRAALEGRPITVFGDGTQSRDFTYVGDIVRATRAAMDSQLQLGTYNLGGGETATVRETLQLIEDQVGVPLDIRYSEQQKGDVRQTAADTARARADLAFRPQIPLREGLRRQVAWQSSFLSNS